MARNDETRVGESAKSARIRAGLTLEALAKTTGLSKGHLSRFERGQKTLSVAALLRLCDALEVSIGTILGDEPTRNDTIVRLSKDLEYHSITESSDGPKFAILSSRPDDGSSQTLLLTVPAHYETADPAHHSGREGLFVTKGELTLTIGNQPIHLGLGDYVEFEASQSHFLRGSQVDSEVLLVIFN